MVEQRPPRTLSIDVARGAVMVLMVLDHARDFFFGFNPEPTDLAATQRAALSTRWVTHFCAPVFVFLAGTSAYLYGRRYGNDRVPRYLLTRGAWLVVLELTIVRFGFDTAFAVTAGVLLAAAGVAAALTAAKGRA